LTASFNSIAEASSIRRELVRESGMDYSRNPRFTALGDQPVWLSPARVWSFIGSKDYMAYVVGCDGRLLAHSDPERHLGADFSELPQVKAVMKAGGP